MASSSGKRMRLSTPFCSKTESAFMLKIRENRNDDMIVQLDDEGYERKPTSKVKISNMVDDVYFQDNTLAFKTILSLEDLVLIIYPPGSGKTTIALILQSYLSTDIVWSDKLTTFFKGCEFAKKYKADYERYKKSSTVAYISFENIQGATRAEFEQSLIAIMLTGFGKHFSENVVQEEEAVLKTPGNVYVSLMRLVLKLLMIDKTKTTYLLLDLCDTVYNTIAQLGAEAVDICKRFTKFLKNAVPTGNSGTVLICFGVSPYFAYEFSGKAHIYDIGSKNNDLGSYFSYSAKKIDEVIKKLNLKTSFDECQKIAEFKYGKNTFINPGICVSFLRSLESKKNRFQVDIIPRSLWLGCIFTTEDRDLLLDVLCKPSEREFTMKVSIMDIIGSQEENRKFYYTLFIYGGFISCERKESKKYVLSAANQVAKCLLEKILKNIYMRFYNRSFEAFSVMYKMILNDQWQEFCDEVSDILSAVSTKTMNEEKDYNNFLFGLLSPGKFAGYSVNKLGNNIALAGLFPDITDIAASWELKYFKGTEVREIIKEELTLEECYAKANVTEAHKRTVLKLIQQELPKEKVQANQYASSTP